ncbi:MAG: NlpC/P60 family protein [Desulfobulbaceae bacterium]|nr:NlpC/P60 family protein [Desulfobulbaceae bacterium]
MNCEGRVLMDISRQWLKGGLLLVMMGMLFAGCAGHGASPRGASSTGSELPLLGYTVQVGAFAKLDNAVRLMTTLQKQGLDAYYFKHSSGLFKVRFGDFATREGAKKRAVALRKEAVIHSFYIVKPTEYGVADNRSLRKGLVKTAKRFLGVPYKWGGESSREGFDCSGLTMTVYRLNGMNLPRNSRQQYRAGRSVRKGELKPGDLVFFATKGGKRINHVGIYLGGNRFIHAPRTGKTIRVASLTNPYFRKRYRGGRTYLSRNRS